jgi:hypothetical protein
MDAFAVLVGIIGLICTAVAVLIAMDRSTGRPLPRFSLRSIFIITAIVAGFSYAVYWCHHAYYVQLYDVREILAEDPEIDRVWLATNDDLELEVEQVFFSIKGQPDEAYYSGGIDTVDKREFRKRLEHALKERKPAVLPSWVVEYGVR